MEKAKCSGRRREFSLVQSICHGETLQGKVIFAKTQRLGTGLGSLMT